MFLDEQSEIGLAPAQASACRMSFTSPVATSSQTSKLSRPPRLTIHPTLQRPFGVQVSRAACTGSGSAKQRGLPTQTRASALAIAAVISSSVSSGSVTVLTADQAPQSIDQGLRCPHGLNVALRGHSALLGGGVRVGAGRHRKRVNHGWRSFPS
jgi:hypothetical protein